MFPIHPFCLPFISPPSGQKIQYQFANVLGAITVKGVSCRLTRYTRGSRVIIAKPTDPASYPMQIGDFAEFGSEDTTEEDAGEEAETDTKTEDGSEAEDTKSEEEEKDESE